MPPNRAERRRTERERRKNQEQASLSGRYSAPDHGRDRVLVGLGNIEQTAPLIQISFEILHNVMGLVDELLRVASSADQSQWFPNNIAAMACLGRSYQSLQSCAVLCVAGLYLDSKASIRVVYEAAGLAVALAKSTQDAEQWLHENHWKSDGFTRKIRSELSGGGKTARRNYEGFYKDASAYAYPAATSVLPVMFGGAEGEGFGVRLYPEFDAEQFRSVTREITAVALFLAFACVDSTAEVEVIPADWLQHLNEQATKFDSSYARIERDWQQHEQRHQALTAHVRHDAELNQTLNEDPNSTRNLKKTYVKSPLAGD